MASGSIHTHTAKEGTVTWRVREAEGGRDREQGNLEEDAALTVTIVWQRRPNGFDRYTLRETGEDIESRLYRIEDFINDTLEQAGADRATITLHVRTTAVPLAGGAARSAIPQEPDPDSGRPTCDPEHADGWRLDP